MPLFGKKESASAPRPEIPSRPSPAPKPLFAPKPSFSVTERLGLKPTPSKPSFGTMESLGLRPSSKPEQKQASPELKKLFGKEGYGTFEQFKTFAKKVPYGSKENILPGTSHQMMSKEKAAIIDRMRERAVRLRIPGAGSEKGTLGGTTYQERLLPDIKRELSRIAIAKGTGSKEYKSLDRDRQVIEQMRKGIPK